MTNLIRPDSYLEFYAAHKTLHPEDRIMLRAFRKQDIVDVDRLLEISKGNRESIKTNEDWNVLANLVIFYIQRWPQEWKEFRTILPDIRSSRNTGGYSKSKEIMHVASLPFRLERLIKIIFPQQQYTKKFIWNFSK